MIATRCRPHGRQGFSLVEMSLVLVIVGAMGMVMWKFMPAFKSLPAIARLTATPLERSGDALDGYILANGRLPCPATSVGGAEACGANGEWLPARTLGLNLPEPVRYGVYRAPAVDADLAVLNDRYQPLLPPGVVSAQQLNGLDFCVALINSLRTPPGVQPLTAGAQRVPIAYGLAVAGAGDADGDGSPFDGLNRLAGRFELAGAARNAVQDDASRAVGAGELLTRLGCVTRLSAVNGAARAAYAAYDIDRFAGLYADFRDFDIQGMEGNVEGANVGLILASLGLAVSSAGALTAAIEAEQSKGLTVVVAGVAIFAWDLAIAGEVLAIVAKVAADDALKLSQSKLQLATDFKKGTVVKPGTEEEFQDAIKLVQNLDKKGLLP